MAPGPARPPHAGGRSLCLLKAGQGRGIPGSGFLAQRSSTSVFCRPGPFAPWGPLAPSCLGKPRAPDLPPKAKWVRWGPRTLSLPTEEMGSGRPCWPGLFLLPLSIHLAGSPPAPCPGRARGASCSSLWPGGFRGESLAETEPRQLPRWGGASDASKGRWRGWEGSLPAEPALPGRDY